MRIRAKISYQALKNGVTIQELIVKQIVASYQEICQKNKDYLALKAMDSTEQYYQRILACNLSQTLKVLMEINAEINNDRQMLKIAKAKDPWF
jgi:hypothetical protein